MRRLTGPGSIIALAVKPLLALAVMLTVFAVAPAVASAAPAQTDTAVTSATPMTGSWNIADGSSVDGLPTTNAVFNCNWFSRSPFQIVDFTCQVTAGAMRVYIICSNGQRINSTPLPAVGTYNVRLICPGVRVATIGWESIV
jgi:hypothetical protein